MPIVRKSDSEEFNYIKLVQDIAGENEMEELNRLITMNMKNARIFFTNFDAVPHIRYKITFLSSAYVAHSKTKLVLGDIILNCSIRYHYYYLQYYL